MGDMEYITVIIEKARIAQKEFETYSQEQVDQVVKATGKAVYDNGEDLARLAVDETKMGNFEDKIMKNKGKAMAVWNYLKGKKSVGILKYIEEGIVEVGKPIGIIGAVTPVTNPVMTPMHNAMIALKGRNAIVICPHPGAKKSPQHNANRGVFFGSRPARNQGHGHHADQTGYERAGQHHSELPRMRGRGRLAASPSQRRRRVQ